MDCLLVATWLRKVNVKEQTSEGLPACVLIFKYAYIFTKIQSQIYSKTLTSVQLVIRGVLVHHNKIS